MNIIDKCIGAVSPKWGYSRLAWRESLRQFYDSGSKERPNSSWNATNATAQQTDKHNRDIIRARARDLERNSDIAEAIISPFVRNVIGSGMKLQAKIKDSNGEDHKDLNRQVEELWKEWCRARNCDITGQQCFSEMQQMAMRRIKVDGGILFVKTYTDEGDVPFQLQIREVDELDISKNSLPGIVNSNRIVDGIELNKYNKPVGYWFKEYTPDGYYTGKSERIDSKRVIFLLDKTRPSQIREISSFAKTITRVRDINEFAEAVSVKERILACLSVFITKNSPGSNGMGRGLNSKDEQSGYKARTISPGMIQELNPGESVTAINPSGQSSNAKEFITTQQRLAGSGQGLSYEAVSRDMSQVNYSSARQGLLEDQRTYEMWQHYIIEHLCIEVYTEFFISAVLQGTLNILDFWNNKKRYLKHDWVTPGWSWIDPLKEVNANIKAVESNMDTLQNICSSRGLDWNEVIEQRQKELEILEKLGLGGANNDQSKETDIGNSTAKDN